MGRGMVALAVIAALLSGTLAGVAEAKKKEKLTAKVAGKALKVTARFLAGADNGFGGIGITGIKATRHGRSVSTRNISLGCVVPGLAAGMAVPVTVACSGAYLTTVGVSVKAWVTDSGISLTVTSFDGTRLVGTFTGAFERPGSTNPTDPPATVENGRVSVDLLGG